MNSFEGKNNNSQLNYLIAASLVVVSIFGVGYQSLLYEALGRLMDYLLIVGQNTDYSFHDYFEEQGYIIKYCHPSELANQTMTADVCLLDLRGSDAGEWPLRAVQLLDHHILFLVLVDPKQLKHLEVASFIAQFAWDYHTAPVEIERLSLSLGHMLGLARLKRQCRLPSAVNMQSVSAYSPIMQQVKDQIARVAPTNIPVLIRGESGTGKERVAYQLHSCSDRSHGPFIAVNCGAIASGLAQSDLFGHEKGAFTGAVVARKGKIAQANGGTLFLDEIGDLPMDQQANLLRFLQEGKFDVLGGSQICDADVRIVAATHVDLDEAIEAGRFRLDLFYRLNGITLNIPPLRERQEEILPLTEHFIKQYVNEFGLAERTLSREAKQVLLNHDWPGNVREMINYIRRAVVLSEEREISASDLGLTSAGEDAKRAISLKTQKNNAERAALEAAIKGANGQVAQISRQLQISRATLYRLIEKHQLPLSD